MNKLLPLLYNNCQLVFFIKKFQKKIKLEGKFD